MAVKQFHAWMLVSWWYKVPLLPSSWAYTCMYICTQILYQYKPMFTQVFLGGLALHMVIVNTGGAQWYHLSIIYQSNYVWTVSCILAILLAPRAYYRWNAWCWLKVHTLYLNLRPRQMNLLFANEQQIWKERESTLKSTKFQRLLVLSAKNINV